MKVYDDIVIGSGISGLSAALLLAQNERKILLLEKSSTLGGSLSRFYKEGIPFDAGFHFTGGLANGEILSLMLSALGIRNAVKPIFFKGPGANTVIFENSNKRFDLPAGIQAFSQSLKSAFKNDIDAIDAYIKFIQKIYDETVTLDLSNIEQLNRRIKEDYITFEDSLNQLTDNTSLKAIFVSYSLCYGTPPAEISYADHARISAALYESNARIENGGTGLINEFKKKLKKANVDIRLNTFIQNFSDIQGRKVRECLLSSGENVSADNYIFAIHPKEILKIFPDGCFTKGFVNRVEDFEPSIGFFSLYCVMQNDDSKNSFKPGIATLFSDPELENMFGNDPDSRALTIFKNIVIDKKGKKHFVLNVLEPSLLEDVKKWINTRSGNRPEEYSLYKKNRTEKIVKRLLRAFPEYEENLRVVDSATMLTFRDYLNSFDGAAYGIKQKVGQYNAFGRLHVRNAYAIGQSAVLPGIVGAMLSSFMLIQTLMSPQTFGVLSKNGQKNATDEA